MNSKEKYGYLLKNTILFMISSFGSKILIFLLVPLYTAVLTTSEYGTADLITTTATLLIYLFSINIADSVMRFTIDSNKREGVLSYGIKVLCCGAVLFITVLVPFGFWNVLNWNSYCYVFLFLNFFFVALNQIVSNYLRGIDKIREVATAGLITTVVTISSNILFLVVIKIGLTGYLLSTVLGVLCSTLYCFFCIKDDFRKLISERASSKMKSEMRRYSIPLIFNGIAWWINNSLDKYFILSICGTAVNGVYAVASKIPAILTVFQQIFSQAWNLSAIKEYDPEDKDNFFSNTYKMYNSGLVLACSILILINVPLAKLLFTNDFFVAWRSSSILLISVLFSALSSFVGCIFTATKKSKVFAVSTVTAAVVNTILNAVLIPKYQDMGAAIATALSFYLIWAIRYYCSRKYILFRVNLIRDTISYVLLAIQVIIEHNCSSYYMLFETIVFLAIALLYHNELKSICHLTAGIVKKKLRR